MAAAQGRVAATERIVIVKKTEYVIVEVPVWASPGGKACPALSAVPLAPLVQRLEEVRGSVELLAELPEAVREVAESLAVQGEAWLHQDRVFADFREQLLALARGADAVKMGNVSTGAPSVSRDLDTGPKPLREAKIQDTAPATLDVEASDTPGGCAAPALNSDSRSTGLKDKHVKDGDLKMGNLGTGACAAPGLIADPESFELNDKHDEDGEPETSGMSTGACTAPGLHADPTSIERNDKPNGDSDPKPGGVSTGARAPLVKRCRTDPFTGLPLSSINPFTGQPYGPGEPMQTS